MPALVYIFVFLIASQTFSIGAFIFIDCLKDFIKIILKFLSPLSTPKINLRLKLVSKTSKLITSILVCEAVGLAATPFTVAAIPTWFATLNKPSFSPPNWIFGPVWTILYAMMGVAAFFIWIKGLNNKKVKTALAYFGIQLLFNFSWSLLFFGLRSPLLALVDIVLLWIFILITIMKFYRLSKPAAYLLIPYLLWVTFATLLNYSILRLNP